MTCCLFGTKPLSGPTLAFCQGGGGGGGVCVCVCVCMCVCVCVWGGGGGGANLLPGTF